MFTTFMCLLVNTSYRYVISGTWSGDRTNQAKHFMTCKTAFSYTSYKLEVSYWLYLHQDLSQPLHAPDWWKSPLKLPSRQKHFSQVFGHFWAGFEVRNICYSPSFIFFRKIKLQPNSWKCLLYCNNMTDNLSVIRQKLDQNTCTRC